MPACGLEGEGCRRGPGWGMERPNQDAPQAPPRCPPDPPSGSDQAGPPCCPRGAGLSAGSGVRSSSELSPLWREVGVPRGGPPSPAPDSVCDVSLPPRPAVQPPPPRDTTSDWMSHPGAPRAQPPAPRPSDDSVIPAAPRRPPLPAFLVGPL